MYILLFRKTKGFCSNVDRVDMLYSACSEIQIYTYPNTYNKSINRYNLQAIPQDLAVFVHPHHPSYNQP